MTIWQLIKLNNFINVNWILNIYILCVYIYIYIYIYIYRPINSHLKINVNQQNGWLFNEQSIIEMFGSRFKPWFSKWHTSSFATQLPFSSYYMWSQIFNLFDIVSIRAKNHQLWNVISFSYFIQMKQMKFQIFHQSTRL